MNPSKPHEAADHEFVEVDASAGVTQDHVKLSDLREVALTVTADLGRTSMLVRDVLDLKRGSVVAMDKLAGEMTDVYVNGAPLARGEVVVIADGLHVRIGELVGFDESHSVDDEE